MHRNLGLALLCLCAAFAACSKAGERGEAVAAVAVQPIRPAPDTSHLLVTLELSPTGLRVLGVQTVAQPLPRLRVPEPGRWHLAFRDAANQVIHAHDMAPANERRSETTGPDGRISPSHETLDTTVFVARLPVTAGTLTLTADSVAGLDATPVELGHVAVTP